MNEIQSSVESMLLSGNPVLVNTKGVSMQPLLYQGKTQVLIEPVGDFLEKYDLALFKRDNGQLVLHRIVGFDDEICIIRGDNLYSEEEVYPEQILGKVTRIIRNGKTIPVQDRKYRLYSKLWVLTYPVRSFFRSSMYSLRRMVARNRFVYAIRHGRRG